MTVEKIEKPKKIYKTTDMKKYRRERYQIIKCDLPDRKCECGVTVSYFALSKHRRSRRHKNFVIYTYNEQNTGCTVPGGEIHSERSHVMAEESQIETDKAGPCDGELQEIPNENA